MDHFVLRKSMIESVWASPAVSEEFSLEKPFNIGEVHKSIGYNRKVYIKLKPSLMKYNLILYGLSELTSSEITKHCRNIHITVPGWPIYETLFFYDIVLVDDSFDGSMYLTLTNEWFNNFMFVYSDERTILKLKMTS